MNSFILADGIQLTDSEGLHECYEISPEIRQFDTDGEDYRTINANISADRLLPLIRKYIDGLEEPCFFLCETPTPEQDERELRQSDADPFHCDVYYRDGMSREDLHDLLDRYGQWFLHDGMTCFGMASHFAKEEIYVGRYKVVCLFTKRPEDVISLLEEFGVPREEEIATPWDFISPETPGRCGSVAIDGKFVYDVVEELKKNGLYFAERRER